MSKDNSTPRPWKLGSDTAKVRERFIVDSNNRIIVYLDGSIEEAKANAKLIVRAVNRDHVFEELIRIIWMCKGCIEEAIFNEDGLDGAIGEKALKEIKQVLSKASKLTEEKKV